MNSGSRIALVVFTSLFAAAPAPAQSIVNSDDADRLGMQVFWQASAPLPAADVAERAVLVDDNIYLMTPTNIAVAVHAGTGVTRWVSRVADEGKTVRGPTHSDDYALFTGPGSVKVVDRRTGIPAMQPRKLRGVVITIEHDVAEISLGTAHGVRLDDVLDVVPVGEVSESRPDVVAKLRVTVVGDRSSKGRIVQDARTEKVRPGDRVWADIDVPIEAVKLPFASSSPAVADDEDLYVGAANQRMYSIRFLTGFENWRVLTPKNMSAAPVVYGDSVYFCDQDGRCASATRRLRDKNWEFYTEGPIFVRPVVTKDHVFVASNDRSLYCIQRASIDGSLRAPGDRIWQHRFDEPPAQPPVVAGEYVYHRTTDGLHALKIEDGAELWNRPGSAEFLTLVDDESYLWEPDGRRLIRVKTKDGQEVSSQVFVAADYALANAENQLVILGTRLGRMACLRPKNAPYLKPAQLAMVLQNDRKARELATLLEDEKKQREADAKARAEAERPAERPALSFLEEEDWLISTSDREPVGARGLTGEKKNPAATAEKKPAADEKKAKPKDESGDDDDVWGDDDEGDDKKDDADKDDDEADDDTKDGKKDGDKDKSDDDGDDDDDSDSDDDW